MTSPLIAGSADSASCNTLWVFEFHEYRYAIYSILRRHRVSRGIPHVVVYNLLEAARPDLEEELSRLTGDAAAHHAARFAREAADFGRRARDIFARNVSEYLTEESRDAPTRLEAEEFVDGVDRLREAADRLEARVVAAERARSHA